MSYEYQESIKDDLQYLYEIPTVVWRYKEKLKELDEVYAKAQAFDGYLSKKKSNMKNLKREFFINNNLTVKYYTEYLALREIVEELESYLK